MAGDFIGTDVTGKVATVVVKAHGRDSIIKGVGVTIQGGASNNTIGGTAAADVISGNVDGGVSISGAGTRGNVVEGDLIGTTVTGDSAFPNGYIASGFYGAFTPAYGVNIPGGATDNTVGGTVAGAADVISGNGPGVSISGAGTDANLVEGNLIGTTITGDAALQISAGGLTYYGNEVAGVEIQSGAAANTVGGSIAGAGNVISGGDGDGVWITSVALANVVEGNEIGTDASGRVNLGNSVGVEIDSGAGDNTIGGATAAAGNLIADNQDGVAVAVTATTGNIITADRIFDNSIQDLDVQALATAGEGLAVAMSSDAGGQLQGWFHDGEPDRTYRVDVYAMARTTPPIRRARRRTGWARWT